MDCSSSIFFLSFQDFYTIVLDELVLEVAARHRDDDLAQPSDQDYNRGRTYTVYIQYILWWHDEYFPSYALFEGPSTVCHEMWVFAC
jgi:hypothetical protein